MPESIRTLHAVVTLIATGILFGLGFALVHMAIAWPGSRVSAGAVVICLLLVIIAFLV